MQVREETAKLGHVRQLLHDYLRARKAWKAPRTEEIAEANPSNLVLMDVDALHCKGCKGKKGKGIGKNKGDRNKHDSKGKGEQSVKQRHFDGYCNQCGEYGHKKPDCTGKSKFCNGTCNKCGAHEIKGVDCPAEKVAHLQSESVTEPNEEPSQLKLNLWSGCMCWNTMVRRRWQAPRMRLCDYFWIVDQGCQPVLLVLPLM